MLEDNQHITFRKDTIFYKTVSHECKDIIKYMSKDRGPCQSNKMIWLTEDRERALSYGEDLKIFTLERDINLYNLMCPKSYEFFLESVSDDEFKGIQSKMLDIVGEGSLTISDKCLQLYGLLTGSEPFNVEKQLSLLKAIDSNLRDLDISDDIKFDNKQISQLIMTPDKKNFREVIQGYIKIGNSLSSTVKGKKNQRLSIYGLDQILLKLMCLNEQMPGGQNLKGWCVKSGTQTVWTEIVGGKPVSDMGEIALFDCKDLIACSGEIEPVPEMEHKAAILKDTKKRILKRTKKYKYKKKKKYTKKKHKRTKEHKYTKKKRKRTKKNRLTRGRKR
jgi:hypothetical protein